MLFWSDLFYVRVCVFQLLCACLCMSTYVCTPCVPTLTPSLSAVYSTASLLPPPPPSLSPLALSSPPLRDLLENDAGPVNKAESTNMKIASIALSPHSKRQRTVLVSRVTAM